MSSYISAEFSYLNECFPGDLARAVARFKGTLHQMRDIRCLDRRCHYQMVLSDDWEFTTPEAEFSPLRDGVQLLGRLRHKTHTAVEIEISAVMLTRDVGPGDWLDLNTEIPENTLIKRYDWYDATGSMSDLLIRSEPGEQNCLSRVTAIKDGSYLFCLKASAPAELFSQVSDHFLVGLASFELLYPSGDNSAERLACVRAAGHNSYSFSYPASWQQVQFDRTTASLAKPGMASLIRIDNLHMGKRVGALTVCVTNAGEELTPVKLVSDYLQELGSAGWQLNGSPIVPLTAVAPYSEVWGSNTLCTYYGKQFDASQLVLRHPAVLVRLSILSPTRDTLPEWWGINKRAFEIVRDSLKIDGVAASPSANNI